jgi:hypothetical protein
MSDELRAALIELSVANEWEAAVREWQPAGCERRPSNCICGVRVQTVFYIKNIVTSEVSGVGSSCIRQFDGTHLSAPLNEMVNAERRRNQLPVAERQLPEQYRMPTIGLMKYKDITTKRHLGLRRLILRRCRLSSAVKEYLSAQS